jgi:hypothetical protein
MCLICSLLLFGCDSLFALFERLFALAKLALLRV